VRVASDELARVSALYSAAMTTTIECQCACGGVKLAIVGEPLAQFYCHCRDCRLLHGGAYTAESVYHERDVQVIAGQPSEWTLQHTPRSFCPTCGVRVFASISSRGLRGVNGLLLPEGAFTATLHINCESALRPVPDGLPHYRAMPAAFGGSDEQVDW
jgi:hypothetical protein